MPGETPKENLKSGVHIALALNDTVATVMWLKGFQRMLKDQSLYSKDMTEDYAATNAKLGFILSKLDKLEEIDMSGSLKQVVTDFLKDVPVGDNMVSFAANPSETVAHVKSLEQARSLDDPDPDNGPSRPGFN